MRTSTFKLGGLVIVAILAVGFAADAKAQAWYLGGAYSWATADIEDVNASLIDDNATAFKLFLGYEFPQIVGIEAGYVDFGSYDVGSLEGEEDSNASLSSNGWTAALTGRIPLGTLFTAYAKVGYFFWDAKVSGGPQGTLYVPDSGNDPFYGAGLRVNFGKLSILGEYERFDGGELKNDLFSLGLRLNF
jgi:OmpA-OmpF porin, OOP family